MLLADDEKDPHDLVFAAMYCRVDFINPILGSELIDIVREWHKGLRRPKLIAPWVKNIRRYASVISATITSTIPLTSGALFFSLLKFALADYDSHASINVEILVKTMAWLAIASAGVFISYLLAKLLANYCVLNLERLQPAAVSFALTNGDKNLSLVEVQRNNKLVRRFLFSSTWALFLNLLASILALKLGFV